MKAVADLCSQGYRLAALLLCWTTAGLLVACTALQGTQSVAVGDARVEYSVQGQGQPVVVFEAGLGDDWSVWAKIIPDISRLATTFSYSRAGYGHSARIAGKRSGAQIVGELHTLLHQAGLQAPYVLVGHSIGGTYSELFARTYPDEVAGLVLVESRAATMTRRCREARLLACDPPKFLVAMMPGAASAEYAAADETFQQVIDAGPIPQVPTIVLTSTQVRLTEGFRWRELWLKTQLELSKISPLAEQRTTPWSGHYIQRDQPRLVIAAISDVLRRVQPAHSAAAATTSGHK